MKATLLKKILFGLNFVLVCGFNDEINSRNVFLFVNFLKKLFQLKIGVYLPRKVMRQLIRYTSLACLMYKINSKTIIQVHLNRDFKRKNLLPVLEFEPTTC